MSTMRWFLKIINLKWVYVRLDAFCQKEINSASDTFQSASTKSENSLEKQAFNVKSLLERSNRMEIHQGTLKEKQTKTMAASEQMVFKSLMEHDDEIEGHRRERVNEMNRLRRERDSEMERIRREHVNEMDRLRRERFDRKDNFMLKETVRRENGR